MNEGLTNEYRMLKLQISAATLIPLTLAACGAPDEAADPPTSEQTADPAPGPEEAVSILRPEIDPQEPPEPPLANLTEVIPFPSEEIELGAAAKVALQGILVSPQLALGGPVTLRGHSDAGGDDEEAMRASKQRAETVRDWMTDNGLDEDRITIIAFGDQNPVAPNLRPDGTPNPQGRARNRRVEIEIPAAVLEGRKNEETDGSAEARD